MSENVCLNKQLQKKTSTHFEGTSVMPKISAFKGAEHESTINLGYMLSNSNEEQTNYYHSTTPRLHCSSMNNQENGWFGSQKCDKTIQWYEFLFSTSKRFYFFSFRHLE